MFVKTLSWSCWTTPGHQLHCAAIAMDLAVRLYWRKVRISEFTGVAEELLCAAVPQCSMGWASVRKAPILGLVSSTTLSPRLRNRSRP
jgi:hypothetical protein